MLSSAFFLLAVKWLFFFKPLRPFLEQRMRNRQKVQLLAALDRLRFRSFASLAVNAISVTNRVFDMLGGKQILSCRYLLRLAALGSGIGLLFSFFALFFVANDFAQAMRLLHKSYWWQLIIFPSLLTGAFLCPLDISIAHVLARWATRGGANRCFIALFGALPTAYSLWGVGAGIAGNIGILISIGFFMPSMLWNRIMVAWLHPITNSGSMQIGKTWFSYGLLAASSALSTLVASIIFLTSGLLKSFPAHLRDVVVLPMFWILRLLHRLERRGINYPVGILIWAGAAVLLTCAIVLRLLGA